MVGECKVVIFMDDVIVHGNTHDELTAHVSEFLQTCKNENLHLKISKLTFETQEVDFLGYKIKSGQYSPCPIKMAAIKDWPAPTNLKELRSFIGFCNFYRMFIANFSQIAHPLHLLTKKNQEYVWEEPQKQAFEELKNRFRRQCCDSQISRNRSSCKPTPPSWELERFFCRWMTWV